MRTVPDGFANPFFVLMRAATVASGEERQVDRLRFEVNWRQVDTKDLAAGGSWGLLFPAGDVT